MGSGSSKAHESFVVTPTAVFDPPVDVVGEDHEVVDEPVEMPDPEHIEAMVAALETLLDGSPAGSEPAGGGSEDDVGDDDVAAEADVAPAGGLGDPPAPACEPAAAGEEFLTPVPTDPTPGEICGTPLLVGGADLDDSLATLVSYQSKGGPREVLLATVTPEAEAKLYEALALSEATMVPVSVDKEVTGRLPLDQAHQLHEQLVTVAKSVNHHLGAGDAIPVHTHANLAKAQEELAKLAPGVQGEADKAMVAHYQAAAATIAERLAPGYEVPYASGGKVPMVAAYETTGTVSVTEYVPAPAPHAPEGLLAAQMRPASRIGAKVGAGGSCSWDGTTRTTAKGKEYLVDLGDGYSAVYRPYAGAAGAADPDFSHRGALELIAPQGPGHGPELVRRLGQLNLVNRPMTAAEGEWSYLRRNIEAQGLGAHPAVAKALADSDGLEDATTELLVAERAHQAIGLDHHALVGFAKGLRLEAEARALPEKVRLVRDGVAKAKGLAGGTALAAAPGYQPTPRRSGGWLVWDRFDVTADPAAARAPFAKRGLHHRVTNKNLIEILTNGGVLASTERRRLMGVKAGKGMSESSDMASGGAQSVFLRVGGQPSGAGPALFWADPTQLLRRSDWYAYNGDHFGSLNPKSGHSTAGLTRNPATVAGFSSGSNEVMFRHGIDLLGAEAPSLIRCASATERAAVLKLLAERNITELGGRPVDKVVQ
ncbi:MAG TPA: hypothetical protein VFJ85_01070 [Acidimicrobiales bacterium]|nr:hypothetical protein [Acidimicrobiales bacterium]